MTPDTRLTVPRSLSVPVPTPVPVGVRLQPRLVLNVSRSFKIEEEDIKEDIEGSVTRNTHHHGSFPVFVLCPSLSISVSLCPFTGFLLSDFVFLFLSRSLSLSL